MDYGRVVPGRFISRPNRFIAYVETDAGVQVCHVKNTGRCRELLVPGARVWLVPSDKPERRTRFDLVAVEKGDLLINMDSVAPNAAFGEFLRAGGLLPEPVSVRPETVFGGSRFDFYLESGERRGFCEVKGVTLERDGLVLFPDAPTVRGARHMLELIRARQAGYLAWAVFVVQMERARLFQPNRETDPEFADALLRARDAGVELRAYLCRVSPESMSIFDELPIKL